MTSKTVKEAVAWLEMQSMLVPLRDEVCAGCGLWSKHSVKGITCTRALELYAFKPGELYVEEGLYDTLVKLALLITEHYRETGPASVCPDAIGSGVCEIAELIRELHNEVFERGVVWAE
jgi:hypothetical protein